MQTGRNIGLALAVVVASSLVVTGCGRGGDEKKASQVAVKVNKDEITVHQLNHAMQRLGNVPEAQVKQAQKQVLERLVDQQLLVQQAMEKKLDRDPRVLALIEAARRQILAQAYAEQVAGGAAKAETDSIRDFYEQHPELFKDRKIYRFAQLAIVASQDKQPAIRAKLEQLDKQTDKTKILPQFADWLRGEKLQFRANQVTQAAEQLPMETLPRYHKMQVGDLILSPAAQGILVAQLTAAQSVPLNEQQAQPLIEQYLQNRERIKLSEEEMKRLRGAAKIEYVGEFAKLAALPQPTTAQQPATAEPTAQPQAPRAASATESKPEEGDQSAIQKGIKGLR